MANRYSTRRALRKAATGSQKYATKRTLKKRLGLN